jgi:hypothetical protein
MSLLARKNQSAEEEKGEKIEHFSSPLSISFSLCALAV